ncbi:MULTISPECIES: histidine kinase [unclassified Streptomyces]|uniref:sensor histidine kinase n=1 Tax=unclassified Streptomyces TaxID=2593676 RepID=UPI000DBAC555|nr:MULTISPECIES: histidine kinase [unclassified Streptomyces]MYT75652.1 two-component sensor histidine kinase [Streptomyces sp. SID8367]RAJ87059.1 signal transduction histidine kinase [Streptomyces sp. PsTaAH-137]
MRRFPGPLIRAVTYTRWLHLLCAAAFAFVCAAVFPGLSSPTVRDWLLVYVVPVPFLLLFALVPVARRAEGLQARLMLFPGGHARVAGDGAESGVSVAPSASWRDRARTAVWLVLRLFLGLSTALATGQLMALVLELISAAAGRPAGSLSVLPVPDAGAVCALLVPVPVLALLYLVAGVGWVLARVAPLLLGPSAAERLAALEERTEQLLERNRIARELHDSIGHALTVAVVQAGAARATGDPAFTERALDAIEETGRAALEDLERVLLVLREAEQPAGRRPTLQEADRLLDSARASGATVEVAVDGPLETVPGPVSREGYRILQEALTNVLRHCGTVPVTVALHVADRHLVLEVRNPLPAGGRASAGGGTGSGLRGVRERAALLGGRARTGPLGDEWQVHVELPVV